MNRKQANQFDQEVLDLYDDYAHGRLDRRDYVKRLAAWPLTASSPSPQTR